MKIPRFVLLAALGWTVVQGAEVQLSDRRFTLPEGFSISVAAGAAVVQRPVSASFDDQGHLFVTDSSGSNEAPEQQLKNPTHRLLRLTDTDGDGVFDRSEVFADKVMFPQGCLWHAGSVYVAAPPSIWKFTDSNGDGVADQREEWFKGGTLTGCANDIHGPYLGPDGFLYWTKGAFAEQTHALGNGRVLKDKAAHIYRARPDGSGLDVIMNGGMDNPVEIAFTPEGETLFSSTFIDFTQPGFRDGLAHAIYGGVYGKENGVLEDGRVKRTGPELFHPFYQAGPAAECGLMRYEGNDWGVGFRDNLFATSFNLHKVTRHVLRPQGATYASTDSDFLTESGADFHPTDVLQDADGSLLVVDTGGWYKLCCPSSQLAKPDVLGTIYRIRKQGTLPPSSSELVSRRKALVQPPSMAKTRVAQLKQTVWKASPAEAAELRNVLQQRSSMPSTPESPAEMRVASEGLGRLRDRDSVPLLIQAAGATTDEFLTHSLIHALIQIADPASTRAGLQKSAPRAQRAALIALDQMDGSDLKPNEVVRFLGASDESLNRAARWILGRHPNWGGELAGWFRTQLSAAPASGVSEDHAAALGQMRILAGDPAGQQLIADAVSQAAFSAEVRLAALGVIAESSFKEPPSVWVGVVQNALGSSDAEGLLRLPSVVRAARSLNSNPGIQKSLQELSRRQGIPASTRLDALAALPSGTALTAEDYGFARTQLSGDQAPAIRSTAASLLARARLNAQQLSALTSDLQSAGPLELNTLLAAFDVGGDEALGSQLVRSLQESKSARALTPGQLRPHFTKFPETTKAAAGKFLSELNTDAAQQAAHLESLLQDLKGLTADTRRGQALFNGTKAACSSCHRIGYLGGNVGPELTKIGEVRSERDLLESIVYPNASFVRSYEPTVVVFKDGDEVSGILRRETDTELFLVTGPAAEQRIPRTLVKELRPGTLSVMPGGFDQVLTRQELADLLTFVKTVRWR